VIPRSQELIRGANEALRASEVLLSNNLPGRAVSDAYYAMLYAARAALSEINRHARTQTGTWGLFYESFVATGAFDRDLFSSAHATQEQREDIDYGAAEISQEEGERVLRVARDFVDAVRPILEEPQAEGGREPDAEGS
jgi:uncharacterized protein (UPF0332 family)